MPCRPQFTPQWIPFTLNLNLPLLEVSVFLMSPTSPRTPSLVWFAAWIMNPTTCWGHLQLQVSLGSWPWVWGFAWVSMRWDGKWRGRSSNADILVRRNEDPTHTHTHSYPGYGISGHCSWSLRSLCARHCMSLFHEFPLGNHPRELSKLFLLLGLPDQCYTIRMTAQVGLAAPCLSFLPCVWASKCRH